MTQDKIIFLKFFLMQTFFNASFMYMLHSFCMFIYMLHPCYMLFICYNVTSFSFSDLLPSPESQTLFYMIYLVTAYLNL